MKPYRMFVIATPEGWHIKSLVRATRTRCIEAFHQWQPDLDWRKHRRAGWKCVPVMVSQELSQQSTARSRIRIGAET